MGIEIIKPCCDPMRFRILHYIETNGQNGMGINKDGYSMWYDGYIALADVEYCPWCGKKVERCEADGK